MHFLQAINSDLSVLIVCNKTGGTIKGDIKKSIDNKLLIYKAVIKPIRSYGTELWGCDVKSNRVIMLRSQSNILSAIANAARYVANNILHTDFNIT